MKKRKVIEEKDYLELGFDFEKVEKILRRKVPIRFSKYSEKEFMISDLKDFIKIVLYESPSTYYVSNGKLQCCSESSRSLGDLYRLRINYYPETKLKDFALTLWNMNIITSFCVTIQKRVYDLGSQFCFYSRYNGITNLKLRDEYFPGIISNNYFFNTGE